MIFNNLTLRNFGVFRGEQTLNLTPSKERGKTAPIVLIGGVNGGGKTTLLDAVQLLLYGNRAPCTGRAQSPYDDFLRESIHRGVDVAEGAGISLSFSYVAEGCEHNYEVTRSWSVMDHRIREQVSILKDGVVDRWMASNWNQLVEDLIPLGISQLCFFDAEKIRFIAEDDQGALRLDSAIKSLMGLDLAERLESDTRVLQARIGKRIEKLVDQREVEKLEDALESKQAHVDQAVQELAGVENLRQAADVRLRKAEEGFKQLGGPHWQQRETHQRQLLELEQEMSAIETRSMSLAGAELPLALICDLLQNVAVQCERETVATDNDTVCRLLTSRDQQILDILRTRRANEETITAVREFTDSDRAKRSRESECERRLFLSSNARSALDNLLERGIPQKRDEASKLAKTHDHARSLLEQLRRTVAVTPDDATAREAADELKSAVAQLASLEQKVNRLEKQVAALRLERDNLEKQLQRLRSKIVEEQIFSEEAARVGHLVIRTQETMKKFLNRSLTRKLSRLSELITESIRYLLRKKRLIHGVQIDPETFGFKLYDQAGSLIPKHRLSEGEKQILAISVLWGMSQASARPIPTIVDTPMARLDLVHRQRLVKRYFPHASHQVIVLSTDTEVDAQYFNFLEPYTSRAYHLNYDDKRKMTVVEEGFFWSTKAALLRRGEY